MGPRHFKGDERPRAGSIAPSDVGIGEKRKRGSSVLYEQSEVGRDRAPSVSIGQMSQMPWNMSYGSIGGVLAGCLQEMHVGIATLTPISTFSPSSCFFQAPEAVSAHQPGTLWGEDLSRELHCPCRLQEDLAHPRS